jgi:hypothetical protein
MTYKRCKACGGIYSPIQPDGSAYFHACPPIVLVRIRRQDGTRATIPRDELQATDQVLRELMRDRPNRRDENTLRREGDRGEIRVLRAEGLGVEDADPPAAEE